jgi:hypothetical protein
MAVLKQTPAGKYKVSANLGAEEFAYLKYLKLKNSKFQVQAYVNTLIRVRMLRDKGWEKEREAFIKLRPI